MATSLTIDSRGRPCPLPVIDLAKAIDGVPVGGLIRVLADDAGARADIPAWCRMRGHELHAVEEAADHQVYVVLRSG